MTATVHTQDVSASPFTLSQTDQIPFFFCAIPYHLIDDDVFPQLKGNHIKLLLVIDRYRNLKLKQKKQKKQQKQKQQQKNVERVHILKMVFVY